MEYCVYRTVEKFIDKIGEVEERKEEERSSNKIESLKNSLEQKDRK